jgi:hypothetical protein
MKPATNPGQGGDKSPPWILAMLLLTVVLALLFLVVQRYLGEAPDAVTAEALPARGTVFYEGSRSQTTPVLYDVRPRPVQPVVQRERTNEVSPPVPVPGAPLAVRQIRPPPFGTLVAPLTAWGGVPFIGPGVTNYRTSITGKVALKGSPPREHPLPVSVVGLCNGPVMTRNYVVGANGGLADVLVEVQGRFSRNPDHWGRQEKELTFLNCQIQPTATAVRVGERLSFASRDGQIHRLQISPSLGRIPPGQQIYSGQKTGFAVSFLPEVFVPCRCVFHDWETAYVSVLDHPYFAVTSTNGLFVITNLPPGQYTVEARHLAATGTNAILQRITLSPTQTTTVEFVIEPPVSGLAGTGNP